MATPLHALDRRPLGSTRLHVSPTGVLSEDGILAVRDGAFTCYSAKVW
jgi:hypothetical protein